MNTFDRSRIRQAFHRPVYFPVKVSPEGFDVRDQFFQELKGRITKMTLVRKLFEDGSPICQSPDGIRADDGTLCDECQHPRCQPRLRIELAATAAIYVMDLPPTSAHNLFAVEDQALAQGQQLIDWSVELTVINHHDHWGEVVFKLLEQFPPKNSA